jgi:diacylglycerol kinase (ATP)
MSDGPISGTEAPEAPAAPDRTRRRDRLSRRAPFRRGAAPALPRQGSLRWSFTWAFEGIVYVLRTQRNMQLHLAAGVIAIVMGLAVNVTRLEMVAILGAVSLVLIAEMINTAVEAAIDAVVTDYHPLVKIAKDVCAGAVLVAAANAVAIAYLVFYSHLAGSRDDIADRIRTTPTLLVVAALLLTIIASMVIKAATGRGTPLRGGWPSGHAAAAFSGWAAITIIADPLTHAALLSILAFMMALLVAQSRVEAGIHSGAEVVGGALIGTLVTVIVFQAFG